MNDGKISATFQEDEGIHYEIKIKGHLDSHWSDWMGGMKISQDGHGNSIMEGVLPDQAALHGILAQIRDLGLTLVSITSKGVDEE